MESEKKNGKKNLRHSEGALSV